MKRPLFWASLCVVAGISCALLMSLTMTVGIGALVLLFSAVSAILRRLPAKSIIIACLFFAGVLYGRLFLVRENAWEERFAGETEVSAVVTEVREKWFAAKPCDEYSGFAVLVYCKENVPEYGDYVILKEPFAEIEGPSNEGEFDARAYYRGIGVLLIAGGYEPTGESTGGIKTAIARFRKKTVDLLERIFPEETQGIAAGILCGVRDVMDGDVYERYRDLGIAHVLAVSGMHVAALGGAAVWLFRKFLRTAYARLAASVLLLMYGVIAGFPISCVRAVLYFLFVSLGLCLKRTADRRTAVAFLAALVMLKNPAVLFQTGFVLSFACAFAILLIAEGREDINRILVRLAEDSKKEVVSKAAKGKFIAEALKFSLMLQFLLLPVQVGTFYRVTTVGFLLNAVIVPLLTMIFLSIVAGVAIAGASVTAGRFAAGPAHFGLSFINRLTVMCQKLPGTVLVLGKPTLLRYMFFAVVAASAAYLVYRRRRAAYVLMALGFLCFLPVHSTECRIVNLAVGQGDCCVILKGGCCIVIDCGSSSRKDVGEKILQPFLTYHGYSAPDVVFITHTDADHCNGIADLLVKEWRRTAVYVSPYEENSEFALKLSDAAGREPARIVRGGEALTVPCGVFAGELRFDILWPAEGIHDEDRNSTNLIIHMEDRYGEAVFTADADAGTLESILGKYPALLHACEYLKVAHHGSVYSVSSAFYESVSPEVAVVSVGKNTYGHPAEEVLTGLADAGAEVFVTLTDGQVSSVMKRRGLRVSTFFEGRGK